jgi:hypothetical protein
MGPKNRSWRERERESVRACVRTCACACVCGEDINLLLLQGIELRFLDRGTRSVAAVPKFLCDSRICARFHAETGSAVAKVMTLVSDGDVEMFTCNARSSACPVATGWSSELWTKRSLRQRDRANVCLACLHPTREFLFFDMSSKPENPYFTFI